MKIQFLKPKFEDKNKDEQLLAFDVLIDDLYLPQIWIYPNEDEKEANRQFYMEIEICLTDHLRLPQPEVESIMRELKNNLIFNYSLLPKTKGGAQ